MSQDYSIKWANQVTPLSLAGLDTLQSETAFGAWTTAPGTYNVGTIGSGLQQASAAAASALGIVQALPSAADIANLSKGKTGNLSATQVNISANQSLQAFVNVVNAFMAQSNQPVNNNQPIFHNSVTISGNAVVGTNLIGVAANVTANGADGLSTSFMWNRFNANTPSTPTGIATMNYPVQGTDIGFFFNLQENAKDLTTGLTTSSVSNTSNVVTGVVPANSGGANAPTQSPSGVQAAGVAITVNTGVWSVANCSFTIGVKQDGVYVNTRTSSVGFSFNQTTAGHTYTTDVQALSPLGVLSAIVPCTNNTSISGTPVIVATSNPSLSGPVAGNVILDVTYPLVVATYQENGVNTIPTKRSWDFYKNGIYFATELDTDAPSPFAICDSANFNPSDTLETVENAVFADGSTFSTSLPGTIYTCQLAPTLLAAAVPVNPVVLQAGSVFSGAAPVVFTGGLPPYQISVNPHIPGLTVNQTTGVPAGTVGAVSSATYNFTCKDSANTSVSASVAIQITSAVTIPTVARIRSDLPFASQVGNLELGGDQYPVIGTITDALDVGFQYPASLGVSTTINGKIMRWGKTADPAGSGKTVIFHGMRSDDPAFGGQPNGHRTDCHPGPWQGANDGDKVWFACRMYLPSAVLNNSATHIVILDLHGSPDGNGFYLQLQGGSNAVLFQIIRSSDVAPPTGYTNYPLASSFTGNQWVDVIVFMNFDQTGAHSLTKFWKATSAGATLLVNSAEQNALPGQYPSYMKTADYDGTVPTASTGSYWYMSDAFVVNDPNQIYTVDQIRAMLVGPSPA